MKRTHSIGVFFFLMLLAFSQSYAAGPVYVRAVANPELAPGYIEQGADFTIDYYMHQASGEDALGLSMTFLYHSPDLSISTVGHRDIGGNLGEPSILMQNGMEGGGAFWNVMNALNTHDWDGALPDTFNYTTIGIPIVGPAGWPASPDEVYIRVGMNIAEEGRFCIDSINLFIGNYDWAWGGAQFPEFNGPYCWDVVDEIPSNEPPVVSGIPDQTINEGEAFATVNLDDYVADPDNADAEMVWTYSGNSDLTVTIVDRVATIGIPHAEWSGSETITFKATDPGALFDDDAAVFAVTAVNDAPEVGDIPNQTINEGESFVTINLDDYVTDADHADNEISWVATGNVDLVVDITDRVATITTPDAEWSGFETITFTATDPGMDFDADDAVFTVNLVLDPPVVDDIPDQTIDEGGTFVTISLDDYVADPDNADDEITWTYSGNTGLIVDITDRVATITAPDAEWYGIETITFTATDPDMGTDNDAALFTVNGINDAPVVDGIPDQTINAGETFVSITLDDYVTDVDNADIDMYWTYTGNTDLLVDITDRVATITLPASDWTGSEVITFTATDPGALFDEDDAIFTVVGVTLQPPVVDDIPDQTINEGETFVTISLDDYVADADHADNELTWTASGQVDLIVDITDRVATITMPDVEWFGDETITFKATDPHMQFDEDGALFTVNGINDAPVVDGIPDQTINEGETFATINLDDYVADIDNNDDEMSWSYSGNVDLMVDITDRVATISIPGAEWSGFETITFSATDPGVEADDDAAVFTVNAVNDAPVVDDIPDQTINEGDAFATINLDDFVNDVDNTDEEITWTYSGNADLTVDITDRVATIGIPASDWSGFETITFTATDPGALFDDDDAVFTVVAAAHEPPVVGDIPTQVINEGETFAAINLDDYVSDPDNTDEEMTWSYDGNDYLLVDITDRVATITIPDGDWNGLDTIVFRATDPDALFDEDLAEYIVHSVNDAPVVTDIPGQTIVQGESFAMINLDNYVSDVDNGDAEMVWTYSGNTDLTVDITDRIATITPPNATWMGSETITFTATDPGALFDFDDAVFTVEEYIEPEQDSVWVSHVPGPPDSDVIVPVYFKNSEALDEITLPLSWDNDGVELTEVTFDGTLVEYIDYKPVVIDNVDREVLIGLIPIFVDPIAPGRGMLAKLHFHVSETAVPGVANINATSIDPVGPLAFIDIGANIITPDYVPGSILIDDAAGFVCGNVTDEATGFEIPGATVEFWNDFPGGSLATTHITDVNGQFACESEAIFPFDAWAYKDGYYPKLIKDIQFGETPIDIVMTPVDMPIGSPYWMTFACSNNTYYGVPLPIGSVVDAYDPEGTHCGTAFVSESGKYTMPVYGDEVATLDDEGAVAGNIIDMFVNNYPATVWGDNNVWLEHGAIDTTVCLDLETTLDREIELKAWPAWNLISWNVDTPTDHIDMVLENVHDCIDVVLGYEQGGMSYYPDLPTFSTLDNVDHLHGYWVRLKDGCEDQLLLVNGVPVSAATPIDLEPNWNLVSYLPDEVDTIPHALSSLADNNLIVGIGWNGGPLSYWPELQDFYWSLYHMEPGYGYWLKVTDADVLSYPGPGSKVNVIKQPLFAVNKAVELNRITQTRSWVNVYAKQLILDGSPVAGGSEVVAVASDGRAVGAGYVRADGTLGMLPVYGDDPATEEIDGLASGELFTLVIEGLETGEQFAWSGMGNRQEVSLLTSREGDGLVPDDFSLSQNYPNPFNPTTTIAFSIPAPMQVTLEVYNILGKKVATVFNGNARAGRNEVVWNGANTAGESVASGIYFYSIKADEYTETRKMVLMK